MLDKLHKAELLALATDLLTSIGLLPLHPKNKLLLYNRYLLSKISWHLTVANLPKTWLNENLDNFVLKYIRKWLDMPISGTLSSVFLPNNKFGLNVLPPSIKLTQCQIVLRSALKSSSNQTIRNLWKDTSTDTNVQYDQYRNTKEIIKSFRNEHENKLSNMLVSQGSFFSNIKVKSLPSLNGI